MLDEESKAESNNPSFKTMKEAHAYRISKLLPKFMRKNEYLSNVSYSMCRNIAKAAIDDGNSYIEKYIESLDSMESLNKKHKENNDKLLKNLLYADYHLLKLVDEKITGTLSMMNVDSSVPKYTEITQSLLNEKSSDEIDYFKNLMRSIALNFLLKSREDLKVYELIFRESYNKNVQIAAESHGNAGSTDWKLIKELIDRDGQIGRELDVIKRVIDWLTYWIGNSNIVQPFQVWQVIDGDSGGDEIFLLKKVGILKPLQELKSVYLQNGNNDYFKDTISKIFSDCISRQQILAVSLLMEQQELREKEPLLDVITTKDLVVGACKDDHIFEVAKQSIIKAYEAQNELEVKILERKINFCHLDNVRNEAYDQLLREVSKKELNRAFLDKIDKYIEDQLKEDFTLTLLGIALSAGAIACVIFGGPAGLGLLLSIAGAVSGAPEAISTYIEGDMLRDSATAGVGKHELTTTTVEEAEEIIKEAKIMGAMVLLDLGLAGVECYQLVKKVNKISNAIVKVPKGKTTLQYLDQSTIAKLNQLNPNEIEKIFEVANHPHAIKKAFKLIQDPIDAGRVLQGLNHNGMENLAKIKSKDLIQVLHYFDDQQSNIRLLNSISDHKVLLDPAPILAKYDLTKGKSLDEMNDIIRNWMPNSARSVEEIAVILKYRPNAPRVIARVQGANYSTFGNKLTTFVTDPHDIIGLNIDEVAKRLGFDDDYRNWLKRNPKKGLYIDFVQAPPDAKIRRMSWDSVKRDFKKIIETGDKKLVRDLKRIKSLRAADDSINFSKLDEMFNTFSETPIEDMSKLDKEYKQLQVLLDQELGTNSLFTGQAYTADYNYNIGATEWGLIKPGVGLELDDMIEAGYKVKRFNLLDDKVYPVMLDHHLLYTY